MSGGILQILLWPQRKLHIIWSIALINVNQWIICIVGNSGAAGLVLQHNFVLFHSFRFTPPAWFSCCSMLINLTQVLWSGDSALLLRGKVGANVTFNHVTKQNSGTLPGSIRARTFALLQTCHSQLTANLTRLWQPAQTASWAQPLWVPLSCTQSQSWPASLASTPPFSDSMSF